MSLEEPHFVKSLKSYCHLLLDSSGKVVTRVSRNVLGNSVYIDQPLLIGHTLTIQIDDFSTDDEDRLRTAYCFSFGVANCPIEELAINTSGCVEAAEVLVGGIYEKLSLVRCARLQDGSVEIYHKSLVRITSMPLLVNCLTTETGKIVLWNTGELRLHCRKVVHGVAAAWKLHSDDAD